MNGQYKYYIKIKDMLFQEVKKDLNKSKHTSKNILLNNTFYLHFVMKSVVYSGLNHIKGENISFIGVKKQQQIDFYSLLKFKSQICA